MTRRPEAVAGDLWLAGGQEIGTQRLVVVSVDPMFAAVVKSDDPCPCSSQRIARHGVGLPGRRGMLEEVRGKAVVVASLNAGTGLVPV